jgi:hypothetical protein
MFGKANQLVRLKLKNHEEAPRTRLAKSRATNMTMPLAEDRQNIAFLVYLVYLVFVGPPDYQTD